MGRKVMMNEELTGHEEEGEVVTGPGPHEEPRVVVESTAEVWEKNIIEASGNTHKKVINEKI